MTQDAKKQSTLIVPERYFYHSFPRRGADDLTLDVKKGLAILRSMTKSGLLLTPEITEWREPLSDGTLSKPWKVIQKRCCFTELSPFELIEHSKVFGCFALEFEIKTLRQLGGIPVFYLPRASEEDTGLESLAASLLARLGEIQVLLNRLADLEELVGKTNNKKEILSVKKSAQVLGPTRCTVGGAEDLIAFLRADAQPIQILRNALRAWSSFFYPAEDLTYTDLLGYYRQREWRIIANMSKSGQELNRPLEELEKEKLLELDPDFFDCELEFHSGIYKRVDQCVIFSELHGKPIIKYVRRVIVPSPVTSEVSRFLETIEDAPEVVALETL